MSAESSPFKFLSRILLFVVAGYFIYVFSADSVCDKIERATSPISLMGNVSTEIGDNDAGWNEYRIHVGAFLAKVLAKGESCAFIERQKQILVDEALKTKSETAISVTDDEKRRILGTP